MHDRIALFCRTTARTTAVLAFGLALLLFATDVAGTDWPTLGNDLKHKRVTGDKGPATFGVRWQYTTNGDVTGEPAVVSGKVYFADVSGHFYCLNANTAAVVWHRSGQGSGVRACPAVAGDKIYLGKGNTDGMVCRRLSDGAEQWTQTNYGNAVGSPVVVNGKVYYATDDNLVVCLDAGTGAVVWLYDAGEQIWSSPAVNTGITGSTWAP